MKIVAIVSILLFCAAGFVVATKASKVPQITKVTSSARSVQIGDLKVFDGVAQFKVINRSSEKITAFAVTSGPNRIAPDASYFDNALPSDTTFSLSYEPGHPLNLDAVIFESGRTEGNEVMLKKMTDTREGHKIGMRMIRSAANNSTSAADLKAAASTLEFTEKQFASRHIFFGVNTARDHVIDIVSRIEATQDRRQAENLTSGFTHWVNARTR